MNPIYLTALIFIVIVISIGTESSLVAIIGCAIVFGLYLRLGLSLRSPNETNRPSLSVEDDEEHYVMIRQSEQTGEKQGEKRKYPINPERKKVSDENLRKKSRTNNKRGESPTVERRDRDRPAVTEIVSGATSANVSEAVSSGEAGTLHSQRVTAADKRSGIIRFPKQAKILFPDAKSEVEVVLLGVIVRGAYDPRTGPDRERSAVLRVGRDALGDVRTGGRLTVSRGASGTVWLE